MVPREKLEQLRGSILEEFERATRSGGLFPGGGLIAGHLNSFPGEESRFVYQVLEERGLIALVKTLYPKAVRLPNVGCNLNLPGSVAQNYHIDGMFMADFPIANVAAVDTDLVNGALDVVPRSHTRPYKYWQFATQGLYRRSMRVPLGQGDFVLRTSRLWHRGMPNHASVPRPMLALTWEDGGSPLEDPFLAHQGKISFFPNRFRTTLLGRVRERTFVVAPFAHSAFRFVKSMFGTEGYA